MLAKQYCLTDSFLCKGREMIMKLTKTRLTIAFLCAATTLKAPFTPATMDAAATTVFAYDTAHGVFYSTCAANASGAGIYQTARPQAGTS